jgi:hypothetical protein
VPTHRAYRRNSPLVELRRALKILDLEQLLNAFPGRQTTLEIDPSDARLDAERELLRQRREPAKFRRYDFTPIEWGTAAIFSLPRWAWDRGTGADHRPDASSGKP